MSNQFVTPLAQPRSSGRPYSLPGWTMGLAAVVYVLASCGCLAQEGGELGFNNACRTCHTLKEGDNRLGPSLHNIIGRKAGSLPDYHYSSAMKDADFIWDEEKLDRFIAHPDEMVPENNMKPFGGVASRDERKMIIAFLRSKATSRP
jgi:cytochrome c